MFLTVTNPHGDVTSLDLENTPVWRIRFEAMGVSVAGEEDRFALALGIRYITAGEKGTAFATIAAFNTHCVQADLAPILKVLLPHDDRAAAKTRFVEALKVLYNSSVAAKTVDELLPRGGMLVDAYFDIKRALWGGDVGLGQVGALAKGSLEGYHWAITRKRFEGCMIEKPPEGDSAPKPPPPPGEEPETIVLPEPTHKRKKGRE